MSAPSTSGSENDAAIVVRACGRSEVGRIREHNEDSFTVEDLTRKETAQADATVTWRLGERGLLLAVCDGMGGAAAGEDASRFAIEVISRTMRGGSVPRTRDEIALRLVSAVIAAGNAIFEEAQLDRQRHGMGTTATVAAIVGCHLVVGQIGDSRAYVLRAGRLVQITRDQTLVNELIEAGQLTEQEAASFELSNVITQALGPNPQVDVAVTYVDLRRGDTIILSSDGLHGLVTQDDLRATLVKTDDPRMACLELAERANEAGGNDNITVIVAKVVDGAAEAEPREVAGLAAERLVPSAEEPTAPASASAEATPTSPSPDEAPPSMFLVSTACLCVVVALYLYFS